jgi:hypothetical protein
MRRSSSLKSRVRKIEEGRGAGAVNLTHGDGSKQSFNLSRNDRLRVLLASFDLARAARNPDAQPYSSPGAIEAAKAIGRAAEVSPHSRLWDVVAETVRGAEKDSNTHTPDPASDSFREAKN